MLNIKKWEEEFSKQHTVSGVLGISARVAREAAVFVHPRLVDETLAVVPPHLALGRLVVVRARACSGRVPRARYT